MSTFGYEILQALVNDIIPAAKVSGWEGRGGWGGGAAVSGVQGRGNSEGFPAGSGEAGRLASTALLPTLVCLPIGAVQEVWMHGPLAAHCPSALLTSCFLPPSPPTPFHHPPTPGEGGHERDQRRPAAARGGGGEG